METKEEKLDKDDQNNDKPKSGDASPPKKKPTDWSSGQVIVLDDDEPD